MTSGWIDRVKDYVKGTPHPAEVILDKVEGVIEGGSQPVDDPTGAGADSLREQLGLPLQGDDAPMASDEVQDPGFAPDVDVPAPNPAPSADDDAQPVNPGESPLTPGQPQRPGEPGGPLDPGTRPDQVPAPDRPDELAAPDQPKPVRPGEPAQPDPSALPEGGPTQQG